MVGAKGTGAFGAGLWIFEKFSFLKYLEYWIYTKSRIHQCMYFSWTISTCEGLESRKHVGGHITQIINIWLYSLQRPWKSVWNISGHLHCRLISMSPHIHLSQGLGNGSEIFISIFDFNEPSYSQRPWKWVWNLDPEARACVRWGSTDVSGQSDYHIHPHIPIILIFILIFRS